MKTERIGCGEWGVFPNDSRPLVIAGPCSAESEEQVIETAKALRAYGIGVFRAGIWKPRTHPEAFEGVGSAGLPWLRRVQTELGMKTAVEVANARHADEALAAGVDVLWIGARTSVNTFAVQEIADALRGVDVPVLVKNPVIPDVGLWMGAMERLEKAGVIRMGMVHRGFYAYQSDRYRNQPIWQVPIEMRRMLGGNVPIFCDPSHIGGNRKYVPEISQQALDMGFDGLMVESHICPEKALSDAGQQLTPQELHGVLESLSVRRNDNDDVNYRTLLEKSRSCIDTMDQNIVEMLGLRMQMTDCIGMVKRDFGVAVFQPERWKTVLENVVSKGVNVGMNRQFLEELYNLIHQESIRRQSVLINPEKGKRKE